MAELSQGSSYVLKPSGRTAKVLCALLLLGQAVWVGWPALSGWYQQGQLNHEIKQLRERGEPVFVEDFASPKVAEGDNAALVLRAAAKSIDESSEVYKKFDQLEFELPVSDEEMQIIGAMRELNRHALAQLREARGKRGVNWQIPLKRPVTWILIPDLNQQKDLANLAFADVLWQHQMGNDQAAVARVRDLLRMSEAVDQMPHMVSHMVAIGIAAATVDKLSLLSPSLRIGQSEGALRPEEVRRLIAQLLDEKAMKDGLRRAVRWERAENVDTLRSLQDGTSHREGDKDTALDRFDMKSQWLSDARLVLERWSQVVSISDSSSNWPQFEGRLVLKTDVVKRIEGIKDDHGLAALFGLSEGRFVERHWRAIASGRLAAMALAIRLYEVEQGKLPENLAVLVPEYLPAVPLDPMAREKTMGYVADARRPVVYCVGRNGTDEGGSDIPISKREDPGFWDREDAVVHLRVRPREIKPVRAPKE